MKKSVRGKRGLLLAEETLKMVIAVICISFLIYLLTSLYFGKINEQKQKQAQATLDRIGQTINILEENLSVQEELKNPNDWYLFGFTGEEKPNFCAGNNCLCICDEVTIDIGDRQLSECDEKGVCLMMWNLGEMENILIKEPEEGLTNINIKKIENTILIKEIK